MTKRILVRVGWGIVTLIGTSIIVFAIVHAIPADPAVAYAGPQADAETLDSIRREMGLDDPLWQQYLRFLGNALRGDLGRSIVTQQPVTEAILIRFPITLMLSLGGMALWLIVGIPVGVLTARWRDKPIDRVVLVLCMIGISLPTFWLGRLLQFQVAYRAGWLPVGGYFGWRHLVLPWITLGAVGVGYYARLVHSNMVDVMNHDYIRAARAKGLSESAVLFKHALRNAFIPLLTIIGMDTAILLGGVVFTETIFALPGIGSLALQAVLTMDVPMVMGTVLFAATLVVIANIVVDLVYALIDPRIERQ